ncbi:FecR domain-containing protein, partial [Parabacteroides goldsteinii]|uniref:FecR domain-containing protein n=1 Tax=Parabacteroides goldsteinii TaxID=328812 RepID=UPI00266F911C
GFFDGAKNEKSPFIVSTGTLDIRALGTQFNVFCYPDAGLISTSLIEGSVKVYHPEDEANGVVLKPNQQLVYDRQSFQTIQMKNEDDLLW